MIDHFFDKVGTALRGTVLSRGRTQETQGLERKWVEKWDRDLATIAALNTYAVSTGRTLALQGGIAVEAHCGGRLTRPHGDVDTILYMNADRPINHEQDRADLETLLKQEGHTNWASHNPQDGHKIEFRENVRAKPWNERRRLEVNLADYPMGERTQTMSLIDSRGSSHTVTVENIDLLVANKARIIVNNIGKTDVARPTEEQDLSDMRRLMSQPHYNREHCISFLQRHYAHSESLTADLARNKAHEVLEQAETAKLT